MRKLILAAALLGSATGFSQKFSDFDGVSPMNQQLSQSLSIPNTHIVQQLFQRGDDSAQGNEGDNYDFTGYVPINGSSEHGYLSINHETTPGGVTILEIKFNRETNTWEVLNQKVTDFSSVVTTQRNCSGGVTSWGTVVTSEESGSSADENEDGYHDIGWQVEIDPATGEVMDYDGDGTPEKLYALGNFSHENFVSSEDGSVAYEGADMGTNGYVYKFIPETPKKLNKGKLYVLKLNNEDLTLADAGSWVQVPNSTPEECNNTTALAESLGATNFNGVEDVEIGPDGFIYFTAKGTDRVYRFKEGNNVTEVAEYNIHIDNVAVDLNPLYPTTFENPDNLAFDADGFLYIMQDGGDNFIWVTSPEHTTENPDIRIFANTPSGSESTGMTFSPDGRFMFVSIQHPNAWNFIPTTDAAGNMFSYNDDVTLVIARKEHLGEDAVASSISENYINTLVVYPNPVKSELNLDLTNINAKQAQLNIVAPNGKLVYSELINNPSKKHSVDCSNLKEGQYFISLRAAGKTSTASFVKK